MSSKLELNNGKYIDDQMGNGVPEGGTTGQVLAKASNDDYDTEWVTGGGGGSGTVTSISTTSPITGGTITTTGTIGISQATTSTNGYLSSTDWNTFNGKGSGTVTSVQLSAGTGISLTGTNPITTSGTITVTNSAPFTTPLTTKGDIYVRNSSADTRLPVGLDTQVLIADSTQTTGLKWGSNTAATPTGYYGAWQDNVTQTAAASNVGYAMIFRTIDLSNGVTIVTNGTNLTRITFANTGIYNLQFSSQFQNSNNQLADVTIWLRLNGADVAGSSGFVSVPNSHGGVDGHVVVSWNYLLSVVAGEYYELVWSTTDHTHVTMQYYAAGNPPPSAASVILTVTQQSGIMAGTGITAINSLTGSVQTLGTGTSGTDFAISSSGTSHTFNLPTASASNRGALSSSDWTTFNNKQNALTNPVTGTGTNNEIAYFNATGSTIGSLTTATYPSLTELSYVKGVTSSIQTQIVAKQDLSLSSYTFQANNTNATANATAQTFKDASGVYSGSITWTGTTAPSGATSHTYNYTQVGKMVTLNISLVYATVGASLTEVVMAIPSTFPQPKDPTGLTGNSFLQYPANTYFIGNTGTTIGAAASRSMIRKNSGGTGYEIDAVYTSGAFRYVMMTVTYYTS
jgi:hypothetical protein